MSRLDSVNLSALLIALVLAVVGTLQFARPSTIASATPALESTGGIARVILDDGRQAVRDAQGNAIPLGKYSRIVSLGLESDALLAELCERDRLAGVSVYQRGTTALRLAGLPRFAGLDDLEAVITLAPDLVLVSGAADQLDRVARLRQAGLTVCNLGPQRGVQSLLPNARLIGALIGADERAERFVTTFTRRLANVDASLPAERVRRRALYLGVYGREIYGGTIGSVRVYAFAGVGDLKPDAWFDALKHGHTFVTTGPMIDFDVGGAMPGDELEITDDKPVKVSIVASGLVGKSAPKSVRLIRFGKVLKEVSATSPAAGTLTLEFEISPGDGCWLAAHVIGEDGSEAHSTPVYLKRAGFRWWDVEQVPELLKQQEIVLDDIEKVVADSKRLAGSRPMDYTLRSVVRGADTLLEQVARARTHYNGLAAVREKELMSRKPR